MIRPSLTIQNASNGDLLLDESRVSGLKFSTNTHGSASMSAKFSMSLREGVRLLDRIGTPDVYISALGYPIWRGRIEDVEVTESGISVAGFGYWRALLDQPYTAQWSDTKLEHWAEGTQRDTHLYYSPQMYVMDKTYRLYMGLTKNTIYASGADVGGFLYRFPSGTSRYASTIEFTTSYNLPTGWTYRIVSEDSAFNQVVVNIVTNGGSATNAAAS
jgi:hypothetical protein